MGRFKIYLFTCDEDIAIYRIEWQYSSSQDIRLLHHRFLRHTLNQAYIKSSFVKFLYNHFVNFFLHIQIILLPYVVNQKDQLFL
jgi:hypothetical protein